MLYVSSSCSIIDTFLRGICRFDISSPLLFFLFRVFCVFRGLFIMYDIAVIGGGIVGLATGLAVGRRDPRLRLLILEKEQTVAAHQTGHNSGVIHSGIYYEPGSLKATLCREGNRAMVEFCREHGIAHEVCGKLIVAVD